MEAFGFIFAQDWARSLEPLTSVRPVASLPVLGKYRAIDFPLSNMVRSGIVRIAVSLDPEANSLLDHLRIASQWDLDRKEGGLFVLPGKYLGTVDVLFKNIAFLKRAAEDIIFMVWGDCIHSLDYGDLLKFHVEKAADITYVGPSENPNVVVMNKYLLLEILFAYKDLRDFWRDVIATIRGDLHLEEYPKRVPMYRVSEGLDAFYRLHMDALDLSIYSKLTENLIMTKLRDFPPAKFTTTSRIHNSIISDGCIVGGHVINSVVGRNSVIKAGAYVENCILMQDVTVEEGARLVNVIADRYTTIRANREVVSNKIAIIPREHVV
ncbi:glucose-1-phosphate adenylyltransferase [Coprothermobacteraceae bacterium]|nr:glucose-1-phosphate adenylyltransferase [Coprothermobacteraceae bacterium]